MTLQEYEAQGGCEGCYFYGTIDVDGRKGCTFHWFDDESEEWATPDDFFRELDQEFHFNLDPCANEQNHKCEKYFTRRIFEAIAMILSNRNDGVRVQLSEIKTKAAKAS